MVFFIRLWGFGWFIRFCKQGGIVLEQEALKDTVRYSRSTGYLCPEN